MILSIIIVNYNTSSLLENCLDSIIENESKEFLNQTEIIVVDNASSDDSVSMLKNKFPNITLIQNRKNQGFAAANNTGIKKARGEYILLLNSDTAIDKNAVSVSLYYLKSKAKNTILGCRIKNKDGSLQYSLGFLPNLYNIFFWMTFTDDLPLLNQFIHSYHLNYKSYYEKSCQTGWVTGAFFMMPKNIISRIGPLDEKLFMYGEEVEFCIRAKKEGISTFYFKDAEITHLKGASGKGSVSGLVEEFEALKYIFHKHYPSYQIPLLRFILKFGALLRLIIFGIILGQGNKRDIYAKAFKLA